MRLNKIENINLIRKIAWSYHKTTGIDWDELFSEALYHYMIMLHNYEIKENATKGKLSTYLWAAISNNLKTFIKQYRDIHSPLDSIEDTNVAEWYTDNSDPFWQELTEEAQGIANLILKYSEHFVCLTSDQIEQRVVNILSRRGWSLEKIHAGLYNLKAVCNYKF